VCSTAITAAPPAAAFTPATLLAAYGIAIDVERRGETLTFHRTGKDR
jgi:hypothetical protein